MLDCDLDPDEYLPPLTMDWCNMFLRNHGFDPYSPPPIPSDERQSPWLDWYLQLRTAIDHHRITGEDPQLGLSSKPEGSYDWFGPNVQPIENVQQVTLEGDNPDVGFAEGVQDLDNII